MATNVTQVVKVTHELGGYAAARLLLYTEPTDRALIGWQPFSGLMSIGGCKVEARKIVNAANGRST